MDIDGDTSERVPLFCETGPDTVMHVFFIIDLFVYVNTDCVELTISPTAPILLLLATEIKERRTQFDVRDNDSNRYNSKNRPLQPGVSEISGGTCKELQRIRQILTDSIIGMSKTNGRGIFVFHILVVKSIKDDDDGNSDGDDNNNRRRSDFQIYPCNSGPISCPYVKLQKVPLPWSDDY